VPREGAGGVVGVVLVVPVELGPEELELDPDAALAIAAPPPTRAPVAATVVSRDLSRISDSPPCGL
jgi:hypothetical protein